METICPVLFPLKPYPDESLAGLMGRVAAHNNYDEPYWMVSVLKTPAAFYKWSGADVRAASALLAIPEDEAAQRVYLKAGGQRRFFCHVVDERVLERTTYKHCPDCLVERGYHSGVFDLKAVQACPLHLRRLVRVCPVCSKSYSRLGPLFTCPKCSAGIDVARPVKIPSQQLRGTAMIALAAGFPAVHPDLAGTCGVPAGLAHLSLGELMDAVLVFGRYAGFRGLSQVFGYAQTYEDFTRIVAQLQAGWEALRDWPEGLSTYLDTRIAESKARGRRSARLAPHLGGLWGFLTRDHCEPWATVRRAVARFALEEWDGILTRGNSITGPESETERPYLSFSDLKKRIGRSADVHRTLRKAGILKITRRQRHNGYMAVDRASVDEICPPGKPLLGYPEVKRRLGIRNNLARRLVEDQVIEPLLGPVCHGARKIRYYYFTHLELERLVASLNSGWRPRRKAPLKTWTFSQVMATTTRDHSTKALVGAMASGELAPLTQIPEGAGLNALIFDAEEASRFMKEFRRSDRGREGVTLRWVRDNYGLHATVTRGLIAGGHIKAAPHSGRWIRVDKASAEAFHKTWVSGQSLAKANGRTPRVMVRMLERYPGLETIRATATSVCPFYRRDQLEAVPIEIGNR